MYNSGIMDKDYFAKKFIQLFPEHEQEYIDHLETFNELLGHVFFADVLFHSEDVNTSLFELLLENKDTETIGKYVDFIEDMYANGDLIVRDIVYVTILAHLGDEATVLRNFFMYCSETLINVVKYIESKEQHGRWDIRIWYKRGKVYADVCKW